jgi:biopolymer transport protein ExbB
MFKKASSLIVLQLMLVFGAGQALAQDTATDPSAVSAPAATDSSAPVDGAVPADGSVAPVEAAAEPAAADGSAVDQALAQTAEVENPYGLGALWGQGDFIARGTLIIMVIMSAFTWYILVTKLWEQQRIFNQGRAAAKLWDSASLEDGARQLKDNSAYRAIAEDGLNALRHHDGRLTDKIDLQEWVTLSVVRSVERVNSQLSTGLSFLATVGSTSPFVGLFGTVWGIYHALIAIGMSGQASIDKVAGPVGEALIMTAIGLAVAVPAVLGYNWLVRRNKVAMEELRNFSGDVHAYLLMGARVSAPGDSLKSATAAPARPRARAQ